MAWVEFAVVFVVFFVSHSVPVRPPIRPFIERLIGPIGFTVAYSILLAFVLGWLIVTAGRAPYVVLWPWAPWQSYLALMLVLVACTLVAFSIGRPNPFSFGGRRNERFDVKRPGIVRLTRHPLLIALAIWATAHVLANGDAAHVLMFGSFAVFAIIGGRLIDRRKRRTMGDDWTDLVANLKAQPILQLQDSPILLAVRTVSGVCLFILLVRVHQLVLGVSPVP